MKFTIKGQLTGLNEYTDKNRSNKYVGADLKKTNQNIVNWAIREAKLKPIDKYPLTVKIKWYEPNKRRDIDNITFATKFIADSLVEMKIIENDSQKYITKIEHEVLLDKLNPRIEIELFEEQVIR